MKTKNIAFFCAVTTLVSLLQPVAKSAPTETTLSDGQAQAIAVAASKGVFFDSKQPCSFFRTNGWVSVTLPRYRFPGDDPTNLPDHASVVWIDESTGLVMPNPGLVPLSDQEAILIATNSIPIPYDQGKPVAVDRSASLTVVTLPKTNITIAPGVMVTNGYAARIWIDTETHEILDVGVEAD